MDRLMIGTRGLADQQGCRFFFLPKLLIAMLFALLAGCATLTGGIEPPLVTVVNLHPLPSEGFAPRFKVVLNLQNRSNQQLMIAGLDFDLEVDGRRFASGVSGEELVLEPLSETHAEVEVTISGFSLVRQLLSWLQMPPDSLSYEISGHLHLQQGLLRRLAFSRAGEVSLGGASLDKEE